jgi:hypothetical protein
MKIDNTADFTPLRGPSFWRVVTTVLDLLLGLSLSVVGIPVTVCVVVLAFESEHPSEETGLEIIGTLGLWILWFGASRLWHHFRVARLGQTILAFVNPASANVEVDRPLSSSESLLSDLLPTILVLGGLGCLVLSVWGILDIKAELEAPPEWQSILDLALASLALLTLWAIGGCLVCAAVGRVFSR